MISPDLGGFGDRGNTDPYGPHRPAHAGTERSGRQTVRGVSGETDPSEYCSSNSPGTGSPQSRACQEAAYGSMSPTTRGYWPGKIYSLDSRSPSATRVELSALSNGEDTNDFGKSYQPTVLPFAVGGYRWAIFTSPRAYGNQFNARASAGSSLTGTPTDFTCAATMLWVAAIDDRTADGSDRSHPTTDDHHFAPHRDL